MQILFDTIHTFVFWFSKREFAAKEKLEIVRDPNETAQILELAVAAGNVGIRSSYFQYNAQNFMKKILYSFH